MSKKRSRVPARSARLVVASAATVAVVVALSAPTSALAASERSGARSWFHDPLSASQRAHLAPVPKSAKAKASGALRHTVDWYATASGDIAVPIASVFGHRMTVGQAAVLDKKALFAPASSKLTALAKAEIRRLMPALSKIRTVRCEGYVDPSTGRANVKSDMALSEARAERVCALIHHENRSIGITIVGYGAKRPVMIGAGDRAGNRRVVLVVTGAKRPPAAVQVTKATATAGGGVALRFRRPASDVKITSYEYSVDGGTSWHVLHTTGTMTLTGHIAHLAAGRAAHIAVRAISAIGASAKSIVTVTPAPVVVTADAPVVRTVTPGDRTLTVRFVGSANAAAAKVAGYELSVDGGQTWRTVATVGSSPYSVQITGLTNGRSYHVEVRAVTPTGHSAASTPSAAAPHPAAPGLPAAPTLRSVTAGDGAATVSWSSTESGRVGYEISTDSGATWHPVATSGSGPWSVTVSGLSNGTRYHVEVRAVSVVGHSSASGSLSVTPHAADPIPPAVTVPGAPNLASVTGIDGGANVTFAAPSSTGGSPISRYEVSIDGGATWTTAVTTGTGPFTTTLHGLTDGTSYHVEVRAVNTAGHSSPSTARTVVPFTAPDVPSVYVIAQNDASAEFPYSDFALFQIPVSTGGLPITGYQFTLDGGATWQTMTHVQHYTEWPDGMVVGALTGLQVGHTYQTAIRAVTAHGYSAASPISELTQATKPGAPTVTSVVPGDGSAAVTFTPSPVQDYSTTHYYSVSIDGGVTWVYKPVTGAGPYTVSVGGLSNGTAYHVIVRSGDDAGYSVSSNSVAVTPVAVPAAPMIDSVHASDSGATIIFQREADGGSAITGYEVSTDGGTTWSPAVNYTYAGTGADAPQGIDLTGLTNGQTYVVEVRAVNAVGASVENGQMSVTPITVPDTPGAEVVSVGDHMVTVRVLPNGDGGAPITEWDESLDGGSLWNSVSVSPDGTFTFPYVSNGQPYSMILRADNAAGSSPSSASISFTPAGAPDAPVLDSVDAGDGAATLTFEAPASDHGATVLEYEASTDDGVTWVPITTAGTGPLTAALPGLTNGTTYHVVVRADNSAGDSAPSNEQDVVPAAATPSITAPAAPTLDSVTAGDGSASVTFEAPSSDGGAPVTGYEVTTDGGTSWSPVTTTGSSPFTVAVSGLTNGTTYAVSVRAVNSAGSSAASAATDVTPAAAATPPATPGAPTLSPIPMQWDWEPLGSNQFAVTSTPPVDATGITGWEVQVDNGSWQSVAVTDNGDGTFTTAEVDSGYADWEYGTEPVRMRATTATGHGDESAPTDYTYDPT